MFRKTILSTVSVLAMLLSAPVLADDLDFAGTLTGQYTHVDLSGLPDANLWGFNGAGVIGLNDTGLNVELDAGYNHLTDSGVHANDWNIGGSLFWKGDQGRVGANVNYTQVDVSPFNANTTNYGGFGEFYANQMFTFGLKAGGFGGNTSGDYVAGGVTGYVFPDFAVLGSIDYTHFNHAIDETDFTAQGEYLLSEETPISAFLGYTYSDLSNGGGHANTFFVGLRLYTNNNGATTLVDRQRSGTVGGLASFGPIGLNF